MDSITVRIPATSANLGPGFDCLGVALALYSRVTVRRGPSGLPDRMVDEAARAFFDASSAAPFAFAFEIHGDIPRSRGLGSSVVTLTGVGESTAVRRAGGGRGQALTPAVIPAGAKRRAGT